MADRNYVIDIILNARDNTAAAFAKATGQAEAFKRIQEETQRQNERTGQSYEEMARKLNTSQAELNRQMEKARLSSKEQLEATMALEQATKNYIRSVGDANTTDAQRIQKLKELQNAETQLTKVLKEQGDQDARRTAQAVTNSTRRVEQAKAEQKIYTEAARIQAQQQAELDRAAAESARNRANMIRELDRVESDIRRNQQRRRQQDLRDIRELETARARALRDREIQETRELGLQREYIVQLQRIADLERQRREADAKGDTLQTARIDLDAKDARAEAVALATELRVLFDHIEANVDLDAGAATAHALELLAMKEVLGKDVTFNVDADVGAATAKMAVLEATTKDSNSQFGLMRNFLDQVRDGFHQSSGTISSFDNFLRGLLSLGIAAFFGQLVLLAGAAAGALTALASSAAVAGAALGGALTAGIAQALGPLGILFAAFARVASVMDAVKQANLLEQQQSYQGTQRAAQQANAMDRIAEAQKGVNDARQAGIDKLNELILAERGLALTLDESEAAIRKAVSSGQTGALPRAFLRRDEARSQLASTRQEIAERTAAGPEGSPEIQTALNQLEDARRAAAQADAQISSAAGKLNFLLGNLSAAERRLYAAVLRLQNVWRGFAQDVTAPLIDSFTFGINRVVGLLSQDRIRNAARGLADDMGIQFRRAFSFFTSDQAIGQVLRIVEQARQNLTPLTDIAINLGRAFADVAEAAGPAFREILLWVRDISDRVADFFEQGRKSGELSEFFKGGVVHLKAWGDLLWNIINLFRAIAGPGGGARTGLALVQEISDAIRGWADAISTPGTKLNEFFNRFFDLSRKMWEAMVPVFEAIAEEIDKTFTKNGLKSVEGFSFFLAEVLVPAVGDFARLLGSVSAKLRDIGKEHPALVKVAAAVTAAALAFSVFGRILTIFGPVTAAIKFFGSELARASGALSRFGGLLVSTSGSASTFSRVMTGLKIAGPFAAAASAVLYLYQRAGKLDDIFQSIGDTGKNAWKDIKPAFDDLKESVDDLVDAFGGGEGLMEILDEFTKIFADVLIVNIEQFGVIVGGVIKGLIRVFAGLIDIVSAVVNLFSGDFDEAGKLAVRGFKKIGEGIWDALWGTLKGIGGMFVRLFKLAVEKTKEFLGISSPSKLFMGIAGDILSGLLEGLKSLPRMLVSIFRRAISGIIDGIGGTILNLGKRIAQGVADGIKSVPGAIGDAVDAIIPGGGDVKKINNKAGDAVKQMGAGFQKLNQNKAADSIAMPQSQKEMERFRAAWSDMWKDALTISRRSANGIEEQVRQLRTNVASLMNSLYLRFRRSLADIQDSASARLGRLTNTFERSFGSIQDTVYDAVRYISRSTNTALRSFDADPVRVSVSAPAKRRAEGGPVTGMIGNAGERGGDFIPTLLGRGEAVLNWAHQKVVNSALWNTYGTTLGGLFKSTSAYHAGGPGALGYAKGRLPDVDGALPGFGAFMQYFRSKFGDNLYVMSGSRPGSITTSGNVSNHASRQAIDISTPTIAGATQSNPPPKTNVDNLHAFIQRYIPAPPRLDFLWRTMTGGNHFNHIHLGLSELVTGTIESARRWIGKNLPEGDVFGGGASVKLMKVLGKDGPLKDLATAIVKKATAAANKFIDKKLDESMGDLTGDGESFEFGEGVLTFDEVAKLAESVGLPGVTFAQIAKGESGFNPRAVGNDSGGTQGLGLWQITTGYNDDIIARFGGREAMFDPAINAQAAKAIYDRQGIGAWYGTRYLTDPNAHYEGSAEGGFAGEYAKGGELPGPHGQPIPILAHAGEWVVNRMQQSKLAALAGTSVGMLRRALGFVPDGRNSFADGGEVSPLRARLNKINKGTYEGPDIDPESLNSLNIEISRVFRAIRNISPKGKIGKRLDAFMKNIKALTDEGGYLDQLGERIEEIGADAQRNIELAQAGFVVIRNRLRRRSKGPLDDAVEIARRSIEMYEDIGEALRGARREAASGLGETQERIEEIRKGGVTKKETDRYRELLAARQKFQDTLNTLDTQIAENQTSLYDAWQERFKAQTEKALRKASQLGAQYDLDERVASAGGRDSAVFEIGVRQLANLKEQQGIVGKRLAEAQKKARTNPRWQKVADELLQQYQDLTGAIADQTAENLQRQMEIFKKDTETLLRGNNLVAAGLGLGARISGALGQQGVSNSINEIQLAYLQDRQRILAARLAEAQGKAGGDARWQEIADDLVTQLQDVAGSIVEKQVEILRGAVDAVEQRYSNSERLQGLSERLAGLRERAGDRLGAIRQRQSIGAARLGNAVSERAELLGLLGRAQAEGNEGVARELVEKIEELNVSIEEQTASNRELTYTYRQAATDIITGRSERSTGLIGTARDIFQRVGGITGNLDIGKLTQLLNQTLEELRSAGFQIAANVREAAAEFANPQASSVLSQLASAFSDSPTSFASALALLGPTIAALEATMGETERTAFQALIQSMIDNTTATLENNQQLQDLNGQSTQTWSSSAWQWFREAIFTGMGNVLPQYQSPQVAMANVGGLASATGSVQYNTDRSNVASSDTYDVTINEAGGPVDVQHLISRLAFEKNTRGR